MNEHFFKRQFLPLTPIRAILCTFVNFHDARMTLLHVFRAKTLITAVREVRAR
jgi:hypothetical protein